MDSRVVESHGHECDEHQPHNTGLQQDVVAHGAEERHHDQEKKSVLNKVKGKAKKIKDTIKKHGHHHDPDHDGNHGQEYHYEDQENPDDHDLDEEDDEEDEAMVEDPEVHGAPIVSPTTEINQNSGTGPTRTFVGEESPGQSKVNLERPVDLDEDPHVPASRTEAYTPPNYQTKVTDPTEAGTTEIDITPVEKSIARMNVHDEPKPNPEPEVLATVAETQYPSAGTHGQFAPEMISTSTDIYQENSKATGQTFNSTTKVEEEEQPDHESMKKSSNQNSYTDKISSATSAIADKAVSAKNAVASKLSYGEKGNRDNKVTDINEGKNSGDACNVSGSTTEHGKKIAASLTEKLAPVYGKIAGVGSAVKSKVSSSGVGTEAESGVREQDKGVSVKEYLAEKLRPGEEDKALSQVISEALYKRKEEPTEAPGNEERDVTQVVSDAIHKREEEPEKRELGNLKKVTESEEVKRRLGTGDESEESNVNSPGKGVVGKLKNVVGSWFGKSGENQSSQVAGVEDLSGNSGADVQQFGQAAGEGKTSGVI